MRVGVDHLDVPRAALVGDLGDRTRERKVVGVPRDAEQLPRLEVDADLDREACVAGESLLGRHGAQRTRRGVSFPQNSVPAPW